MKKFWTDASDAKLTELIQKGEKIRKIGDALGVSHEAVRQRLIQLKLWSPAQRSPVQRSVPVEAPSEPKGEPDHIRAYKAARRGFSVPAHLEGRYLDLLKSGVSIAEARQELEIITNAEE